MPPNIRHFLQAVHLCPDRWGSCDQIRSQFEHKGHNSIFLTTIVAFVLSLHDILHLWCMQEVDGRIGCLHAQPVDQLYPLLPHQEAMFNDVVDSLAQRRRFLDWSAENVSSSSDNWSKYCLLLGKPGTGKSQIAIRASRVPEGNSRAMHSGIVSQKKWAPSVTIWRVSLYSMRSLKRVFIYNTVFLFL